MWLISHLYSKLQKFTFQTNSKPTLNPHVCPEKACGYWVKACSNFGILLHDISMSAAFETLLASSNSYVKYICVLCISLQVLNKFLCLKYMALCVLIYFIVIRNSVCFKMCLILFLITSATFSRRRHLFFYYQPLPQTIKS